LPSDKRSWTLESEPWQVLEVPADATEEEIAEAYNAFHDKFLSTRCDLSDVELKAAEVLLAKKRQAHDFLLDREFRRTE
jgi:DnaJ-class molecular chaperone